MILVNISDIEAKEFQKNLFDEAYDFNMDKDVEINPMTHSEKLYISIENRQEVFWKKKI